MTPPADLAAAVLRLAQGGDRPAQAAVLERYAGLVHSLVRRSVPSGDTDELTQGALQRLLAALPRFDPDGPASFTTWVYTVAHRFLIDEHRKRKLSLVPLEEAAHVADEAQDPHGAAWKTQVRSALEAAIAALPVDQRRVFVLAHLHGQSLEAIAQVEDVPLGTVKSRLFRARAVLAARLGPQLGLGGSDADR